jgi:hypothetical protein
MILDFTTGMGRGIYTQEQSDAHRCYNTNLASRQPTMTVLASAAANNAVGGRLGSYLGQMDMDQINAAMIPIWFLMLYTFGEVWHYLTGLGLIFLFLKIGFGFTL